MLTNGGRRRWGARVTGFRCWSPLHVAHGRESLRECFLQAATWQQSEAVPWCPWVGEVSQQCHYCLSQISGGQHPTFCSEAALGVRSHGKRRERIGEQPAWNVNPDRGPRVIKQEVPKVKVSVSCLKPQESKAGKSARLADEMKR